jgi:L-lysine exporter family protein LysE/ArgO
MVYSFLRGMSFGGSLIVAIGAQNAFVIRQALTKRHLLAMALLCASIDAVLILFGVFGFGVVIEQHPFLLIAAKYFAIIFLVSYSLFSFRVAFKNEYTKSLLDPNSQSLKKTILTIMALSLLNPHVYLDTVILLGSIAAQEAAHVQAYFACGAITASFIWFFSISYGSSLCARWLMRPSTLRLIDFIVAITMLLIALSLI